MTITATESTFEEATLQRLQTLGYRYQHGTDIDRAPNAVVLEDVLSDYLSRRYRSLPPQAVALAVQRISTPEGLTLYATETSIGCCVKATPSAWKTAKAKSISSTSTTPTSSILSKTTSWW